MVSLCGATGLSFYPFGFGKFLFCRVLLLAAMSGGSIQTIGNFYNAIIQETRIIYHKCCTCP
jgi:hypothetical protein